MASLFWLLTDEVVQLFIPPMLGMLAMLVLWCFT